MRKANMYLVLLFFIYCGPSVHNLLEDKSRSLVIPVETEKGKKGEIVYFPQTFAGGEGYSLILTTPVILDEKILYSGKESFINYFTHRGVSVWLVRKSRDMSFLEYGRDFLKVAVEKIRKQSAEENWFLGGMSLGGLGALYYLMEEETVHKSQKYVKKAFFLGTGFDYSYTRSVAEKFSKADDSLCEKNESLCIALFGEKPPVKVWASYLSLLQKEQIVATKYQEKLREIAVDALFIGGKIDNFAPSESIFPVYSLYGAKARFYQASEVNFYEKDFHHIDLFCHPQAFTKLYDELNYYLKK